MCKFTFKCLVVLRKKCHQKFHHSEYSVAFQEEIESASNSISSLDTVWLQTTLKMNLKFNSCKLPSHTQHVSATWKRNCSTAPTRALDLIKNKILAIERRTRTRSARVASDKTKLHTCFLVPLFELDWVLLKYSQIRLVETFHCKLQWRWKDI